MTKGIIKKTKQGWTVVYDKNSLPLHPDDVKKFALLSEMFDNFEARIKKDPKVDFEIVDNFAKLIHDI